MPRFNGTAISVLLALGIAGSALAPSANAAQNNGAFAKSGAAAKSSQATCDSLYAGFSTAVNKGLAASHTGDKQGQAFYTTVAEIYVDLQHKGGCEGF